MVSSNTRRTHGRTLHVNFITNIKIFLINYFFQGKQRIKKLKSAESNKVTYDVWMSSEENSKSFPVSQSQQSKMIKPKKFKRFIESPTNNLKTMNRFSSLPIEECNSVESEIKDQSDREPVKFNDIRQSRNEFENKRMTAKKVIVNGWKRFETRNRFEALVDNPEEDPTEIIKRNQILNTPKHCLRKCSRCKFKKRTCTLDSSTCQAIKRNCFK